MQYRQYLPIKDRTSNVSADNMDISSMTNICVLHHLDFTSLLFMTSEYILSRGSVPVKAIKISITVY